MDFFFIATCHFDFKYVPSLLHNLQERNYSYTRDYIAISNAPCYILFRKSSRLILPIEQND